MTVIISRNGKKDLNLLLKVKTSTKSKLRQLITRKRFREAKRLARKSGEVVGVLSRNDLVLCDADYIFD